MKRVNYVFLLLFFSLFPIASFADDTDNSFNFSGGAFTTVGTLMKDLFAIPENSLANIFNAGAAAQIAQSIFVTLFILETLWMLAKSYLETHHDPLRPLIGKLIVRMITGSFLYWLIIDASGFGSGNGFISEIVEFFLNAAQMISGASDVASHYSGGHFQPGTLIGSLWDSWTDICTKLWGTDQTSAKTSVFNSFNSVVAAITNPFVKIIVKIVEVFAMAVMFVFTFMTAWMLLFKVCEFIIVAYGTVFMIGFLGSQWTKNYFDTYIKYIVTISIEFFIIIVILNYGEKNVLALGTETGLNFVLCSMTLIFKFIFLYQLLKLAPKIAAGVTSGSPQVSTGDAVAAVGGLATGAAAVAGAIGGGGMGGAMGALQGAKQGLSAGGVGGAVTGALQGAMQGMRAGVSSGNSKGTSGSNWLVDKMSKLGEESAGSRSSAKSARGQKNFESKIKEMKALQAGMSEQNRTSFNQNMQPQLDKMAAKWGVDSRTQEHTQRKHNVGNL